MKTWKEDVHNGQTRTTSNGPAAPTQPGVPNGMKMGGGARGVPDTE